MKENIKLSIYLIRHAEKNEDGSALSKRGKEQTKLLAKRLKKEGIKKIISSDLDRCKQTADIINKSLNIPASFNSDLREVEGKVKEKPEKYPKEISKIKRFWNRITKKERGKILLVASGNINRILIALALKINPKNSRFVQIPTGLTYMDYFNKNQTRLGFVNDASHLPDKLKIRQAY